MTEESDRWAAAIRRKEAIGRCEACGEQHWHIEESSMLFVPAVVGDTVHPDRGTTMVQMRCGSCGLIRFFHSDTLLN